MSLEERASPFRCLWCQVWASPSHSCSCSPSSTRPQMPQFHFAPPYVPRSCQDGLASWPPRHQHFSWRATFQGSSWEIPGGTHSGSSGWTFGLMLSCWKSPRSDWHVCLSCFSEQTHSCWMTENPALRQTQNHSWTTFVMHFWTRTVLMTS